MACTAKWTVAPSQPDPVTPSDRGRGWPFQLSVRSLQVTGCLSGHFRSPPRGSLTTELLESARLTDPAALWIGCRTAPGPQGLPGLYVSYDTPAVAAKRVLLTGW